jgi:hypothetical protein
MANAKAELAKLPASRSIAELESLIRRGYGSPSALAGHVRSACPKYDAERGIAGVGSHRDDFCAPHEIGVGSTRWHLLLRP